jgi:hypothetical protein
MVPTNVMLRRLAAVLLLVVMVLGRARPCQAGGGPENLFLVVNSNSWASVTVANEFIALRGIPAANVLYLDWRESIENISGATFREKLLSPAIEAMKLRGLFHQIDYIVYSSDLPYCVNLKADFPKDTNFPQAATPTVSINSATYLWYLVIANVHAALELNANQYMRNFTNRQQQLVRETDPPTHGFRSWYGWDFEGRLREGGGQPYMLSTMLAYTSGRGNSVAEAVRYLRASRSADGTFPQGTIYFTRTSDVRSTTRQDEVAAAQAELEKLGVKSRVVNTAMPMQAGDVLGVMAGVSDFSWLSTRSKILPGAICDNFTSFGGVLIQRANQTPLTEFLRYGAAGAAGTVVEPLAIPQKFASPNIFVHYARGCSLAESYYQSLFAPAQMLIVGDPLCQPWANIPEVVVEGVEPGGKVSGTLAMKVSARYARAGEVARFALFVDGRRVSSVVAGEDLVWDSTTECDGVHELRVVAISAGPIETQGRKTFSVVVDNQGRSAILATRPEKTVRWDQPLQVAAKAVGAKQIHILQNGRLLGTIDGEQGALKIDPRILGLGPVGLQAIAITGRGSRDRVLPAPVTLDVQPAPPLPAIGRPPTSLVPGIMLQPPTGEPVPIQDTQDGKWLKEHGVGANQPFSLDGYFTVETEEVYQFQLWHRGELELAVDGLTIYRSRDGKFEQKFVPVNLAAGLHRVRIAGRTGKDSNLRILFGGPGARALDGKTFQHPR